MLGGASNLPNQLSQFWMQSLKSTSYPLYWGIIKHIKWIYTDTHTHAHTHTRARTHTHTQTHTHTHTHTRCNLSGGCICSNSYTSKKSQGIFFIASLKTGSEVECPTSSGTFFQSIFPKGFWHSNMWKFLRLASILP